MTKSRRNFLQDLVAAGLLTGAIAPTALAEIVTELSDDGSSASLIDPQTGSDVHQFWDDFFKTVGPGSRGKPDLRDSDREVQYLHFNQNEGLRYLSDVKRTELMDYDGDVMVTATLGQFRPGNQDQALLESVKSSSLRVDFVQTQSFLNVLAPMAWAALAVFNHDKANKLPTVNQFGYQKTFMDGKILLPGGSGKFALNLFPVKPESTLHKILKIVVPAVMAAAPVLNFPAISIPVLKTITQLYLGPKEEESYGKPLLNSFPVRWAATQRAFEESLEVEKYPLVDGDYIMVPQAHSEELSKAFSSLDVQQGYLIAKDASKNDSPVTRVLQAIPDVTYVTMSLKTTKVPAGGLPKSAGTDNPDVQPVIPDKPGAKPTSGPPKPNPSPTGTPKKKP